MSCTAKPVINHLSMSNGCLISIPAIFTTKSSSYPSLSIPSKPIKLHLSSSSVPTSFLSLKKTPHPLKLVAFVARTSDWAQQEEDTTAVVDGEEQVFSWSEEGGGEVDASGETDSGGEEGFVEGGYPEPNEDAKLYVGNLPYDVDSERLALFFQPAGVVDVAEVIYDRETDRSRGFAFVTMSTVEEAEKAVQMLNQSELNGRSLIINKAAARGSRVERPPGGFDRPPRAYEPGFKLYVGNLPWVVDNARLEQVFSEYGRVVDTRVIYDRETGRSRGFAFVTMSSEAELNEAVSNLDGLEIEGRAIRVNVAEEKSNRSF